LIRAIDIDKSSGKNEEVGLLGLAAMQTVWDGSRFYCLIMAAERMGAVCGWMEAGGTNQPNRENCKLNNYPASVLHRYIYLLSLSVVV